MQRRPAREKFSQYIIEKCSRNWVWIAAQLIVLQVTLCFSLAVTAERIVPVSLKDQSPREEIRKKIFPEGSLPNECKTISKNPAGIVDVDPSLTAALQTLINGIQTGDDKTLLPLFHPQIKVTPSQIKMTLSSISRIAGGKIDAALLRAFAINNLTGESAAIPCPEDNILLHPLYGHPLQAGVWIQVRGNDDVAKIYAILVPSKDKWQIGAWHVQQWTHAGKDYVTWFEQGKALEAKHDDVAAWIYFDLVEKLLDAGKFIVFPASKEVATQRTRLFGGKPLLDVLQPKFPGDKLVYTASLFSRQGAALLLRFQIPGEWSAVAIREHCRNKFKLLAAEPWLKAVAGVRCGYIMPRESADKEGVLGGIFIDETTLDPASPNVNGR
jgi:hypothetical protein